MTDRFKTWRVDIAAELKLAEQAETEAQAKVAEAEEAFAAAKADNAAIAAAFGQVDDRTQIAGALLDRKRAAEDENSAAGGRLTNARLSLRNVQRRVADLRQALDQIDVIDPPAPSEAEAEVEETAA